jgi:hypothetical protein
MALGVAGQNGFPFDEAARVARAGFASVILAKGISEFPGQKMLAVPVSSEAGLFPVATPAGFCF